jgi:8-oxo-dGTP pyrophosphatase MutT (NUDIX family)
VTAVRVGFVDTFVLRERGGRLETLVLRRGPGGRNPGSWETVHGTIEDGETPQQAARRELAEETGLSPERFYNLSRVESFFWHATGEVIMIPQFAAFVAAGADVRLSPEHDAGEWLPALEARARFAWPRERRAMDDVLSILGSGGGGLLDDVLRIS